MGDSELLDRFAGTNRSAAQRLLDAIRDIIVKIRRALSGGSQAMLTEDQKEAFRDLQGREEEMARLLENALERTRERAAENENAATAGGEARYSRNKSFATDIQSWYNNGQEDGYQFVLGETGEVLQGLGAIENDIYMNGDKIKDILNDHAEMTVDVIKKIPQVLDDPVLVLKSKNRVRSQYGNSRLVMFGNVKAEDGRPVMCVLDLRPTEDGFFVDDMQKVTSAYTKDVNPTDFVRSSDVLHADKKRSLPLLRGIGFTGPMSLLRNGSVGSISYEGEKVNISGVPFPSVFSEANNGEARFSRKRGDMAQREAQLLRENDLLRQQVDALRGEMRRSDPAGRIDQKDVHRAAQKLLIFHRLFRCAQSAAGLRADPCRLSEVKGNRAAMR